MSTRLLEVTVKGEGCEFFDKLGLVNQMLTEICAKEGLHPMAVLAAALVALKMGRG
jgi:hypothetical protein